MLNTSNGVKIIDKMPTFA